MKITEMLTAILVLVAITIRMVITSNVGYVNNACLITPSNSTWLYGQKNSNACLCAAMSLFNSELLALNYFSPNKSCQIFKVSSYSPQIGSCPNSTLILLQSLTTPCCSNITFLLTRVQFSQQSSSLNVSKPTFLSIDSANQSLLSVMSYLGPRTLLDRTNLSRIVNTTNVGSKCAIATTNGNYYISSCDSPYSIRIYNETKSGLQFVNAINMSTFIRQVVFVLNNTWMIVPAITLHVIQFYSLHAATNQYVYNHSIPTLNASAWSLTKRNDSLIYLCYWVFGTPVSILSHNGLSWSLTNLSATMSSDSETPAQVAFDTCGRMWVVVYGFGIRIYDTTGQILLASWATISTTISTILLSDTYEIFFGDYDNDKILHYAPNLQCV